MSLKRAPPLERVEPPVGYRSGQIPTRKNRRGLARRGWMGIDLGERRQQTTRVKDVEIGRHWLTRV
jgi:hypothetical protein